jgi:hypothetical protein
MGSFGEKRGHPLVLHRGGGRRNHGRGIIPALLHLPDCCCRLGPPIIIVWDDIAPGSSTRKPFVRLSGPRLTPCPDSVWKNNNSPSKTKIPAVSLGPATLPSQ